MEKLLKSRAASRGWAKREAKQLSAILDTDSCTIASLKLQIEEFDKRVAALDEVQAKLEEAIDDDAKLEENIGEAYEFRSNLMSCKTEALNKMATLTQPATVHHDTVDSGATSSTSYTEGRPGQTKLPRLEIKKFSGDILDWQTFWDQFQAAVDKTTLPKINKFTYLKNLLEGEALNSIVGLSLTEANYDIAVQSLQDRFGRPERIIFTHIQALLNMDTGLDPLTGSHSLKASQLWSIRDELNAHVRSMEALGVNGEKYGVILTPLILSRLPNEIRLEWARTGIGKEADLAYLLEFLKSEIERRERSEGFTEGTGKLGAVGGGMRPSTVSAMAATTTGPPRQYPCIFCKKTNHKSWQCRKLNGMSRDDKMKVVKENRACFKCFSTSHFAVKCKFKCRRCGGQHHDSLCMMNSAERSPNQNPTENATITISHSSAGIVHAVLQTARVKVRGSKGECMITMMFDTGSDRTYVSSEVVKNVGPEWLTTNSIAFAAFGEGKPSNEQSRNVYKVNVANRYGGWEGLNCIEVKSICAPLQRYPIPQAILDSISQFELADSYDQHQNVKVDILVGLDYYWQLMGRGMRDLPGGLVAQDTAFGWVLSGRWSDTDVHHSRTTVTHQMLCLSDIPESSMKQFWDLDVIGVNGPTDDLSGDAVLGSFNDNIQMVDGRYEVKLPWKEGMKEQLLDNRPRAKVRLNSLRKRLSNDDKLGKSYNAALAEMEELGVITEVPDQDIDDGKTVYYLPHHPVVKETSLTTKVRPVFDASAKGINGVALNDCLETGPPLIPGLVEILIRFRRWQIGLSSDITKAFLQIGVHAEDQDVHRFLWDEQGQVRTMKFLRVPFGNSSSPFLLNATIRYHLSKFPDSLPVTELQDNLYVDDWLSGADFYEDALLLFKQANNIMEQGKFHLASWNSNDMRMSSVFFCEFGEKYLDRECVKILGLKWDKPCDSFGFEVAVVPGEVLVTKRVVLSTLARLYDPLGFLTPFTMSVKILLQDIWLLHLEWDEPTPDVIRNRFLKWLDGLELVRNWQIPRCYTSQLLWSDSEMKNMEIHGFGDASERGYGSVVYVRISKAGVHEVSFVTARARVAPVKKVSLPRLELLGALLTARLIAFVRDALKLQDVICRAWTDSTVALGWIQGDPLKWKTFVRNRVTEIQKLTQREAWAHCPGKDNPADLLTRGTYAEELISSKLWLSGPEWLSREMNLVNERVSLNEVEPLVNVKQELVSVMVIETEQVPKVRLFDAQNWSSLEKALRVIAWAMRFIGKLKGKGDYSEVLSHEELTKAKVHLIQQEQEVAFREELDAVKGGKSVPGSSPLYKMNPFMGDDGLLRVGGRLQQSNLSYDEKHPVIVPKGHVATLLLRSCHVRLQHAGVDTMLSSLRNQYWIIGGRRLAKAVKKGCMPCQRVDAQASNQANAPLPELRVHQAPPFTVTGMDYAGPLFCVDYPGAKFYILLFTCAVVRAIHLELVESLSKANFMLAFRRFAARRGLPAVLYSDNAMTFKGAEKELLVVFGEQGPKWKYIAPRSPWWGGWWERLVRSVKGALKKSLGSRCLTRTELETSLQEVEACVNSRPLTAVRDEVDGPNALTPSHFLIGRVSGFQCRIAENEVEITRDDLSERELLRMSQLELFWQVWSKEYLRNLPLTVNKFKHKGKVGLGSLVLIQEDNLPRMKWPLGLVVKEFPGKDGLIRAFEIKTAKGNLVRPIQRLHDLELDGGNVPLLQTEDTEDESKVVQGPQQNNYATRSGRTVKPIERLDL